MGFYFFDNYIEEIYDLFVYIYVYNGIITVIPSPFNELLPRLVRAFTSSDNIAVWGDTWKRLKFF